MLPVEIHDLMPTADEFLPAVLSGLGQTPKQMPSRFIYDARGSQLFERILDQPEYYIPRVEMALLRTHGPEIAALSGPRAYVADYGSGSGRKARLLLTALAEPAAYAAIDISRKHLIAAARALADDYPALEVHAICTNFLQSFDLPRPRLPVGRRIGFFPGSTIGNLTADERARFLAGARRALAGGALIVGIDLKKDPAVLRAAYNDAAGVSASFNTNILVRANAELGADFNLTAFRHRAEYDPVQGHVEIGIESLKAQTVRIAGRSFAFAPGEVIRTQRARKFTNEEFLAEGAAAGFSPGRVWTDADRMFAVCFLAAT